MTVRPNSSLQPTTVETTAYYVHLAHYSVKESAEQIAMCIAEDML